jgi:hypothetical protein
MGAATSARSATISLFLLDSGQRKWYQMNDTMHYAGKPADVEIWPVGFPGIKRITFEFRARTSAAQDWLEDSCEMRGKGVAVDRLAATSLRRTLKLIEWMRRDGLLVDVTRLVTLDIKTVSKRQRKAS